MSLFSNEVPTLGEGTTVAGLKVQNVAHINVLLVAASTAANVFIAPVAYKVTSVREVHGTAGSTGATVNLEIIPSGTAAGSGATGVITPLALNGTANTPQTATLGTNTIIPAGSRLGTVLAGTLTGLANGLLEISLARV